MKSKNVCTRNPREFWSYVKKLGPRAHKKIPLEVYDESGEISGDLTEVLAKWKDEFEQLYNVQPNMKFDDEFLLAAKNHACLLASVADDPLYDNLKEYNKNIDVQEVNGVIMKSKNRKSPGVDNIPYKVLKCEPIVNALCHFYQLCFDAGKIPEPWNRAIISPIPKNVNDDKRVPLNYRGISLLCCTSKIYSAILNQRMI